MVSSSFTAFITLNLLSAIGLLWLIVTATICPLIKRCPTWFTFLFSWILSSVSYALLFLAGQGGDEHPSPGLCFVQAALIYAMPPTTACTTFAFMAHLLIRFPTMQGGPPHKVPAVLIWMLMVGPYFIFTVLFVGICVFQAENPGSAAFRRDMFCALPNSSWSMVTWGISAVVSFAILLIQARLVYQTYVHFDALKDSCSHWRATTLRGFVFTLTGTANLAVAIFFAVSRKSSSAFDLALSVLPVLVLIVFGFQKDLLLSWYRMLFVVIPEKIATLFLGKPPPPPPDSEKPPPVIRIRTDVESATNLS